MFRTLLPRLPGIAVCLTALVLMSWSACSLEAQSKVMSLEQLQQQLQLQSQRIEQLESVRQPNLPLPEPMNSDSTAPDFSEELRGFSERLNSLETRAETRAETLRELESEFLESPSTDSLRTTTGRLHLDYWAFPRDSPGINLLETGDPESPPLDRFELRRIRIGVRGQVQPKNVSYQLDLEFSGIDSIGIRDAWIGFDDHPLLDTIRIGNQKRPYGLDQLNSSNFMVFIERPMIVEAINDPNRRLGVQSFGASEDRTWNWRYGIFNLVPIEEKGVISTNNYQAEITGRLASTPWYDENCGGENYWHLGIATSLAFPSENLSDTTARFRSFAEARTANRWLNTGFIPGSESYQLLATESVFNLGPVQLGGEYVNLWMQRVKHSGSDLHLHGGYAYLSYFLTGEHIAWNRQLGILGRVQPRRNLICTDSCQERGFGAFQLAARLSVADLNDHDIFGGRGRSATLALNWYWNSHTRLQFNYIFGRIDDRKINHGMGNRDLVSGSYQISGARLMIDY